MRISQRKGRLRVQHRQDDFNPMEGLGNLADAILVFACGLLLALIINWNVQVSETGEIKPQQDKYEIEGFDDNSTETIDGDTDLEEMGTVYMDPATGKYYVVEGE